MIDTHSHILPGIDDGARTFEDSLNIIRVLANQGVTEIIATPHYVVDTIYASTRSENSKLLKELQKRLAEESIDVKLHLGNELYIDGSIKDLLAKRTIATMAGGAYLLVELPLNDEFPNYADILGELMASGYKVVLAHPERYAIIQEDYQVLENLCEMGVLLQCNLGSFLGKYGRRAEKLVVKIAQERRIFLLGSDIHSARHNDKVTKAIRKLHKYYSNEELDEILIENPRKMLESKKPVAPKKKASSRGTNKTRKAGSKKKSGGAKKSSTKKKTTARSTKG